MLLFSGEMRRAPHVAVPLQRADLSLSAVFRVSENQTSTSPMNNLRSGTLNCPFNALFRNWTSFLSAVKLAKRNLCLTFMGPCILRIFQYISNKMQRYTVYLYLEIALHVSGGISTHHQEWKQLYLQHLIFVTPLLLPAASGR